MPDDAGTANRPHRTSRRRFLGLGAATVTAGLAGCTGSTADTDGPVAVASFFTFYDFARQIADGTELTVDNLVPTGLHGHGWEPDPSITRDIIDADAFITVGPDFQPWADRAIRTVEDDGADTHMINAREGVELMDLLATVDDDEEIAGGKDPHFWLDPSLAGQAVDTIADGLVDVVPDEETALRENAESVKAELDSLDAEWEAIFAAAERDVVFLAAHNAFAYVGERYGATIRPLVSNLAAEGDVRPADMQRAEDTIAEYDLTAIGAAVFEPRRPATQLREETAVEAYYPVTPYAGTTPEWVDRGWGYFEIARNINMNTFELLLDAGEPDAGFDAEWRNFE
ncbi:metal ABC transporter substrate-binding protein [Halohasta salina]|uniref:metal ABC transporter substrate-binding protein n=1 Tax=Halohasta salina TaxID=2961621 RepID=UPI0020A26962|nr:metal ABC transporter substrate-binding protein [Halohasta salina]